MKSGKAFCCLLAFLICFSAPAQTALTADGLAAISGGAPSGGGGGNSIFVSLVTPGSSRNNFAGTVGFTFTVSGSITLTDLGSYVISGSSQTHRVGVWNSSFVKVAEVSINKSGLGAGFATVSVGTPVVLTTDTYYIGEEEFSGGDSWYNDDSVISTTADATITFSSFHSGSYDAPSSNGGSSAVASFGPVNFKYHK